MTRRPFFQPGLVAVAGAVFLLAPSGFGQASNPPVPNLTPLVVTGVVSPIASNEAVIPVDQLSDAKLARYLSLTLGETTALLPGMRSTSFGPGASRPVIRGFDGPRVRILESGLDTLDVSDSSPDHAISLEPFFADSIEILRGPSTLLYGSSAVGGVVNVVDARIPREAGERTYSGRLRGGYNSVSDGWDVMGLFTYADPRFAIRVGGLRRDSGDLEIPGSAESFLQMQREREEAGHHDDDDDHGHEDDHGHHDEDDHDHEEEEQHGVLENSSVKTETFTLGFSYFPTENLRISTGFLSYSTRYGVPGHAHGHDDHDDHGHNDHDDHDDHDNDHGEEAVMIDLEQIRWDLEAVLQFDHAISESLLFRFNYADYRHIELEGNEVGTQFDREGWEARSEWRHRFGAGQQGVLGLQRGETKSVATGAEAFTPPSETADFAIFGMEEWLFGRRVLQLGARAERRDVEARGAVPQSYSDWAYSFSAGTLLPLSERWNVALNLARSERHPTATELYADGPHAATRQYEVGDSSLGKETSIGADLALRLVSGPVTGQLALFYNRFDDFINASLTGAENEGLPVFEFEAMDADFYGFELETTWHVFHEADRNLDVTLQYDQVMARDRTHDQWLPRIPSRRLGLRAWWTHGPWAVGSDLFYGFAQNRTAPNELPSEDYLKWDATVEYRLFGEGMETTLFLRGMNLLDEEIRIHSSYLKDLAPKGGRGFAVGFRTVF